MHDINSNPGSSPTSPSISSIRVDRRSSGSVGSAAVHTILKPFRSMILRVGDPSPSGSPELKEHTSHSLAIRKSFVAETWIYTLVNPNAKDIPKTQRIYYFAGGGFRSQPTKDHWAFCTELCMQLPSYEVNIVSSPLAPNSRASVTIPHLEKLYLKLAEQSMAENYRITFMGDSSGGNLSLVLGIFASKTWLSSESRAERPCPVSNIFVISPATDLRHLDPEIDVKATKDPILSRQAIQEVAAGWVGDLDTSDPRISPTLADLSVLYQAGVKVDGVLGGYDVLAPEGTHFRKKLAEANVKGDWLEWEKQMHCFVLTFRYKLPEAVAAKDWILNVLKENFDTRDMHST